MTEPRFSQSGRSALLRAYQLARNACHSWVGPEHLLLGAMLEECGPGRLLEHPEELGKKAEQLAQQLGRGKSVSLPVVLSQAAADVIQRAAQLAEGSVGARDVLLALLECGDPAVSSLLQQCGCDGETLRRRLRLRPAAPRAAARRCELKLTLQFGEDMTDKPQCLYFAAAVGGEEDSSIDTIGLIDHDHPREQVFETAWSDLQYQCRRYYQLSGVAMATGVVAVSQMGPEEYEAERSDRELVLV